jgi:hypothetical protein
MTIITSLREQQLQTICDVLGDTSEGVMGSEIGKLIVQCGIKDPLPRYTMRDSFFSNSKS